MSPLTLQRRTLATAAGAVLALGLAACSAGGSSGTDGSNAAAGSGGAAGGCGGGEDLEFTFATGEAETSPNVTPVKRFMEEVTERTDGRVTWETHYSGSLIPSTEITSAVDDGRIDAGILTSPYDADGFPLYNVGYVPFPDTNTVGATNALRRLYEENEAIQAEADRNNVHFILHTGSTNASSIVSPEPIETMDDLDGFQVRVIGGLATGLAIGGANPVAIPVEETFEALERGVVDGIGGSSIASMVTYSIPDIAPEVSFLPTGHYSSSIGLIINKQIWDCLPDDIRGVMDDVVDQHYENLAANITELEAESCDTLIEAGARFNWFPRDEAEREAWVDDIGNAMFDEWRQTAVVAGVSEEDAQSVEDDFKQFATEEAEAATDYTAGEEACIAKSNEQ